MCSFFDLGCLLSCFRGFEQNGVDGNDGIPIVLITTPDDEDNDSSDEWLEILPLPASRYRYTKWYEIGDVDVTSSSLRSPRVRKGKSAQQIIFEFIFLKLID